MVLIRICYVYFNQLFFHEKGKQVLSGIVAHLGNIGFEGLTHREHNVTFDFVPESKFGTLIDQENRIYDGCIGSIQSNESDWAMIQVPIGDHGPNITQGPAIGFERISILSSYNMTDEVLETDILHAFNSFTWSLWIEVILTFLLFILLLFAALNCSSCCFRTRHRRSRNKYLKSFSKSLSLIIAMLLKQISAYSMMRRLCFTRMLHLSIILFCFWIHFYFCTLIKTELSIVKNPITIENYDDILSRPETLPMWFALQNDKDLFSKAEHGTKEAKIWKKALHMTKGDISHALLTADPHKGMESGKKGMRQEAVLLLGRHLQMQVRSSMCAMQSAFPDVHYMTRLTSDPGSKEMVRVFFYNSRLENWIKRMIHETTNKRMEAGLMDHASKIAVIPVIRPSEDKMRDCMSVTVIKKTPEIHEPHISHYCSLFGVIAAAFLVSLIVLICEAIAKRVKSMISMNVTLLSSCLLVPVPFMMFRIRQ
jgi:hypothetical protein